MADNSAIEWTDATWNPIRARNLKTGKLGWHCEHATTGCEFCYAEGFNKRLGTGLAFKPGHRNDIEIFLDEEMLTQPLRWKRSRVIFPCSMTDLFANFVTDEMLDRIFAVMALTPRHTYQPLTKRAERMRYYLTHSSVERIYSIACRQDETLADRWRWPLPNVWLGVSAERQEEADERILSLLDTPAAVRFISAEPLLGPIDLSRLCILPQKPGSVRAGIHLNALQGRYCESGVAYTGDWDINGPSPPVSERRKLDWVIVGGESGPKARPMHPDWARSLQRQCDASGVKYFFKQWGRWSPVHPDYPNVVPHAVANDGAVYFSSDLAYPDGPRYGEAIRAGHDKAHLTSMYPIGKAKAGRLLDGIEYNEMPEARCSDASR